MVLNTLLIWRSVSVQRPSPTLLSELPLCLESGFSLSSRCCPSCRDVPVSPGTCLWQGFLHLPFWLLRLWISMVLLLEMLSFLGMWSFLIKLGKVWTGCFSEYFSAHSLGTVHRSLMLCSFFPFFVLSMSVFKFSDFCPVFLLMRPVTFLLYWFPSQAFPWPLCPLIGSIWWGDILRLFLVITVCLAPWLCSRCWFKFFA